MRVPSPFYHLMLTTFWNYRSIIASADCFDRYYRLENDRCEHRKSNIGKIGRHPAHRTSDCYMAPIPIRRLTAESLGGRACQCCLFANAWLLDRVKPASKACVWSLCEIWYIRSHMSDARVHQTTAWARWGRDKGQAIEWWSRAIDGW